MLSKSASKSQDGKRIRDYWEKTREEGGGVLHEVLQDRYVEDVDILWCLTKAMGERDAEAIQICGYLLGILYPLDRRHHLVDILGWPTA